MGREYPPVGLDQNFLAARYFVKHVLPKVDAAVKAIRSGDISMIAIPEEAFASS